MNGYHGDEEKHFLINFSFYEMFKDAPVPHKNFTLLGQGNHETLGGDRPWYPLWVPKPLITEGLIPLWKVGSGLCTGLEGPGLNSDNVSLEQ